MNIKQFFKESPMTFILMVLIIGYFVLQFILGVNIDNPSGQDLLRFGANFLPKTINEPYRLLTAGFVHIGIMHLLFNSFALYYLMPIGEKLFGRYNIIILFLLAIIGGNLLNLYWAWYQFLEQPSAFHLSAGASGGVMGINAGLLVISLHQTFGKFLNTKNLLLMLAINIFIGFAISGIDNAGHIGGAITGGIVAFIFAFTQKNRNYALFFLPCIFIFSFIGLRSMILSSFPI